MSRLTALLLLAIAAPAAEFHNGQAARLVIGQPSFSARDAGIAASSLVVSNGRLYATDTQHRLITFNVAKLPGSKNDLTLAQAPACGLCGFSPISVTVAPAVEGSPGVSIHDKTVVVADTPNHRVFIWRDTSTGGPNQLPDVVLGQGFSERAPISASTLIEPTSVAFDGKRLFVGDAALRRVLIWNSLPTGNNQPADVVLGQEDFVSVGQTDISTAENILRPAALASDGTNLFVSDVASRRILVFTPGDVLLPKDAIVNAASLVPGPLAPGTLVTITSPGLTENNASAPDDGTQALPTKLGGVEVIFNGVALPLLLVSPTQIRAQIPFESGKASSASIYVRSEHADGSITITNATALKIVSASPGLFAFGGPEPRSGLILHADPTSPTHGGAPVTSENPAKPGEVLIVWAAGLGKLSERDGVITLATGVPNARSEAHVVTPVAALINGESAQVVSAGLPQGSIGIYEVRVLVPSDLSPDPKAQLLITQNGYVSNKITVPVQSGTR
ncbi:MAG: hypothetical protein JOY62_15995 [Acidobacteriaceae bacterium]|nr:hypothetical protein [Acidobacteriaceae bacterium]MBV9781465.1 hypothetical protein [Acidobacteriaceae bacterium]